MGTNDKIYNILKTLKDKSLLSSSGNKIFYTAGREGLDNLTIKEEISILNKLESEGIIKIINNFSSEYE